MNAFREKKIFFFKMYYWGLPDASVEFCEDKYVEVHWIAEYYNTLSSFLYILVGMCFLNTKIYKIAWAVIGVGVGSILLHGTLRWYGQWMDEIFMLITSFRSLQYVRPALKDFILPIILFIYFFFSEIYTVFLILFSMMNLPLLYLTLKRNRLCGRLYVFSFIAAFFCWWLDQIFCDYFKQLYLHAWWHILTSFGIILALFELLNHSYEKEQKKIQ